LQSAHSELADLRIKLRNQEGQKGASSSEIEQLKKTINSLEATKRERDSKIVELEKALQAETKQRETAEAKSQALGKQLEETRSAIDNQKTTSYDALASAEVEVANTKELLRWCTEQYGTLVAQCVSKSQLEEEKMLRLELQTRLIKMERKLHDKEIQSNELVAYLRYKEEEQSLLRAALKDAEAENSFLRSNFSKEDDHTISNEMPALSMVDSKALHESDRCLAETMEEYYRSWLNTVLDEYKTAAHVAGSLSSALEKVLSRTSELDGELQVARIEVEAARKRSREADEKTGDLVQEVEELKTKVNQTSETLTKEKETLLEELTDARRKLEDGRKRQGRLETAVREKTAAEKALSDDIER
jgi:chromosome segregation ATPase